MLSRTYVAEVISIIEGKVVVTGSKYVEVGLLISVADAFDAMVSSLPDGKSIINFRRVW